MPLGHVSLGAADMVRAKAFYDAVLPTVGFNPVMPVEVGGALMAVGYGDTFMPTFWIGLPFDGKLASAGNGVHVCFDVATRAAVDAFHAAALKAGGTDDGAPGLRPHYHPNYYGAFARDLDGNKIEAVCHGPE